jgi:starch phosphorylase
MRKEFCLMTASIFSEKKNVAYFSMEIALESDMPSYSGGLGVLAGDTLRAAADLGLPVCAVSLLYRKGYFRQSIGADGRQAEAVVTWNPEEWLKPLAETVTVSVEGQPVKVRAWRYDIKGETGHVVPVYFLDAQVAGNSPEMQAITDNLYGGDEHYRLRQETVLGLAGVEMLKALGYAPGFAGSSAEQGRHIGCYHMNEGHAALLTVGLLRQLTGRSSGYNAQDLAAVRNMCVFTTHTPVPAGHDTFPVALSEKVLGKETADELVKLEVCPGERLNMSELAIKFSRFVNGVAKRHAEVSRQMFPHCKVESITNGVHAVSWTADAIRSLFDKHLAGWRADSNYLRYAVEIPIGEIQAAHKAAKKALFDVISARHNVSMDPDVFTIGFARRAAEYKRADLLFHDLDKLRAIASRHPLQIVFAGKAHPKDLGGKKLIENVVKGASALGREIKVVYLENYDMHLGRLITSGVDLWLNNPVKPLEASGTSGMKAAINGVPSLSTLDGWWVEGCVHNLVGWEIEDPAYAFASDKDDGRHRNVASESIYRQLDQTILPMYYQEPVRFGEVMRNAMFVNGPFFNTHRMVYQYLQLAYALPAK